MQNGKHDTPSSRLGIAEREFLNHFRDGNVAAAWELVYSKPDWARNIGYQAHPLLRACINDNSGHCYKESHLQIAQSLLHENVMRFRNSVLLDQVADAKAMLADDGKLVNSEFTAGRGIAQAIHHFRSLEMGNVLVDAGADVNARTTVHHVGDTPVGLQLRFGTADCVELLLSHGANPNVGLLKFMPADAMPELIPLLLNYGWDINEGDGVRTLLHHDAAHGHTRKIKVMLTHGADPHARNSSGQTALHLAAKRGNGVATIQLLRESGARIDAKDNDGLTPLEYAQRAKSNKAFLALLSNP